MDPVIDGTSAVCGAQSPYHADVTCERAPHETGLHHAQRTVWAGEEGGRLEAQAFGDYVQGDEASAHVCTAACTHDAVFGDFAECRAAHPQTPGMACLLERGHVGSHAHAVGPTGPLTCWAQAVVRKPVCLAMVCQECGRPAHPWPVFELSDAELAQVVNGGDLPDHLGCGCGVPGVARIGIVPVPDPERRIITDLAPGPRLA